MGGRPTPEDAAAPEAEAKHVANIRAEAARRMDAARNRFASGGDQSADEFRLAGGPPGQRGLGAFAKAANGEKNKRQGNGDEPTDRGGWKHPVPQHRTAGGAKVAYAVVCTTH